MKLKLYYIYLNNSKINLVRMKISSWMMTWFDGMINLQLKSILILHQQIFKHLVILYSEKSNALLIGYYICVPT